MQPYLRQATLAVVVAAEEVTKGKLKNLALEFRGIVECLISSRVVMACSICVCYAFLYRNLHMRRVYVGRRGMYSPQRYRSASDLWQYHCIVNLSLPIPL